MEGAQQFRDSRMPRLALALVCGALAAMAFAPMAIASSPAGDQYGNPLPTGGGGNSNAGGSGDTSSSGSGSGTVIPVAPDSGSSAANATSNDSSSSGDGGSSAGGKSTHNEARGNGNGSHKGDGGGSANKADPVVGEPSSANSVPQIAADSAGDSWMPFFIAGLIALAAAFALLVFFRNRRRAAHN